MDYNIILGKSTLTNVSDAYSGTLNVSYSQYTNNGVYLCKIDTTNTTISPTLSLNGLTAYPIKRNDGTSILIGELKVDAWYLFMFDQSTSTFEILNLSIPYFNGTTNYIAKYTPTGNVLGISQIFDNGSNVGIGTSTPTSRLQIVGSDSTSSNYALKVQNSGGKYNLVVRNDGNVGIGVPATPNYKLEVIGNNNTTITLIGDLNTNIGTAIISSRALYGTTSNHDLGLLTNGTERLTLLNTGNVGIGTATPTARLTISADTTFNDILNISNTQFPGIGTKIDRLGNLTVEGPASSGYSQILIKNSGGNSSSIVVDSNNIGSSISLKRSNQNRYDIVTNNVDLVDETLYVPFRTFLDSSHRILSRTGNTEVMYIDATVNNSKIGIGTTTPSAKLQIVGSDSTSSNYSLKIDNSASSPLFYVRNDGNVGIGTNNPSYQFTLKSRTSSNPNTPFRVTNSGETAGFYIFDNGDFAVGNNLVNMGYESSLGGSFLKLNSVNENSIEFIVNGQLNSQLINVGLNTLIWRLPTNFSFRRTSDNNGFANIQNGNGDWSFHYPTNVSPYPDAKVTIYGNDNLSTGRGLTVYGLTGTTPNLIVRNDGNVGIGTSTPSEKLEVNGNIKTAQPSANGAGAWKLGKKVTATVSLVTTDYIEVEIDSVVYKLALVS